MHIKLFKLDLTPLRVVVPQRPGGSGAGGDAPCRRQDTIPSRILLSERRRPLGSTSLTMSGSSIGKILPYVACHAMRARARNYCLIGSCLITAKAETLTQKQLRRWSRKQSGHRLFGWIPLLGLKLTGFLIYSKPDMPAPSSLEAKIDGRKFAYRCNVFNSVCPVISAISMVCNVVRSKNRATASWRKS